MLSLKSLTPGARKKSTHSRPLLFSNIPVPPEIGFGNFSSSLPYFAKGDGFKRLFKQFQRLHNEYGPIARLRFLPFTPYLVSIADPDAIAQIFRSEGPMPQRMTFVPWEIYRKEHNMPTIVGNSNDYEEWKRFRASLCDHLLRPKNIPSWCTRIDDVAQDVVDRVKKEAAANNGIVTLTSTIKAYSLEAVSSILFGKRMGCITNDPNIPIEPQSQGFIDAVDGFFAVSERLIHLPPYIPLSLYKHIPAYKELSSHADYIFNVGEQLLLEKIQERKLTGDDLLTLFLQRPELNESEAISQALGLLFAGVDTTANAILWTLYLISTSTNSSEIQSKIRDEVNIAMGSKSVIDEEILGKIPYIRACVKEGLRLYPPASVSTRIAPEDTTIMGYSIPKGTLLMMQCYVMSRDPNVFDNSNVFKPERWLDRDQTSNRSKEAYSTLPFGMGARGCVGRRLAETEIYILLAHIVRNIDLQWLSSESLLEGELQTLLIPEKPMIISCQPVSSIN
ncbi:expressed hypothetical protein [Thraustotheca clavata]|uniref:Cytochrome P450 n=1 Tax=Thraustotheca clavata TaxID=74557 RepID=A0A1V9ZQ08_9STRA|nr:expressed hypothetical protein [Thraustotheca clavata]